MCAWMFPYYPLFLFSCAGDFKVHYFHDHQRAKSRFVPCSHCSQHKLSRTFKRSRDSAAPFTASEQTVLQNLRSIKHPCSSFGHPHPSLPVWTAEREMAHYYSGSPMGSSHRPRNGHGPYSGYDNNGRRRSSRPFLPSDRDIIEGLEADAVRTIARPTVSASTENPIKPENVEYVGSYNWEGAPHPTIIVPGEHSIFQFSLVLRRPLTYLPCRVSTRMA